MGRNSKCVLNDRSGGASIASNKVLAHDEFIDRIRKSLYFGSQTLAEDMEISRPLAEYASELFSEPHKGHSLNRLNSVAAASIHATPAALIMALIYLDRLNLTDPGYVRRITPQELFIVSMMISTKFYVGHDEGIFFSDWAEDGNMTERRLKQLELEFLCAIDWNIYVSNEQFFSKLSTVEKMLARREGLRRGWLTYTELMQMLPSFTLAKFFLNNITILAVSYAASVMTIAGAFFLVSQIPGSALNRKATTSVTATPQDNILLPTTTATHASSTSNLNRRRGAGQTETMENATEIITDVTSPQHNASYAALNVEAELVKLENEYQEEALRENMKRRQHEIASDSRLTLPDAVRGCSGKYKKNSATYSSPSANAVASYNTLRNWLSLKEEYSDRKTNFNAGTNCLHRERSPGNFADCLMNLSNCTSSLFWHLLADAAQQSLVRLPSSVWFKLM